MQNTKHRIILYLFLLWRLKNKKTQISFWQDFVRFYFWIIPTEVPHSHFHQIFSTDELGALPWKQTSAPSRQYLSGADILSGVILLAAACALHTAWRTGAEAQCHSLTAAHTHIYSDQTRWDTTSCWDATPSLLLHLSCHSRVKEMHLMLGLSYFITRNCCYEGSNAVLGYLAFLSLYLKLKKKE